MGTVNNILGSTTSTFAVGGLGSRTSYGGVIANGTGTTALTVVGGSLALISANTYSGPTTISGGTLALGPAGSINSSTHRPGQRHDLRHLGQ